MIKVEIDEGSGFCFGVVTAIHKAEEELAKGDKKVFDWNADISNTLVVKSLREN